MAMESPETKGNIDDRVCNIGANNSPAATVLLEPTANSVGIPKELVVTDTELPICVHPLETETVS